jgi:cystathionine gamma-synthase
VVNPAGNHAAAMKRWLLKNEKTLHNGDLKQLEMNSRDVGDRVIKVNHTTERLCDYLRLHPMGTILNAYYDLIALVEHLYYPKYQSSDLYIAMRNSNSSKFQTTDLPSGGFGGLFSIVLRGGHHDASFVYDRLNLAKGPSLGTNFSLCCPYTLLAHYGELDEVESHGISRNLIRVSIGLEDFEYLKNLFDVALNTCV